MRIFRLLASHPIFLFKLNKSGFDECYQSAIKWEIWKSKTQCLCAFAGPHIHFLLIPTRSCQKFSKQICLWDLAQSIGILFIIQIVEAIWFFVAMVLPAESTSVLCVEWLYHTKMPSTNWNLIRLHDNKSACKTLYQVTSFDEVSSGSISTIFFKSRYTVVAK